MLVDAISLDEKLNTKAVVYGFILLGISVVANAYIQNASFDLHLEANGFNLVSIFISLVIRIIVITYIRDIADELNRNLLFWSIFAFVFPSIALIIIGFLDYKIEYPEIRELLFEMRSEYRVELFYLEKEGDLNETAIQIEKDKVRQHYDTVLKTRINEILNQKEKGGELVISSPSPDNMTMQPNSEADDEFIAVIPDLEFCPACNYRLSNVKICPDCGLHMD